MIGDVLKKTREELGLNLKEISNSLRIQYSYLEALEQNTLEKLPEDVYIKGYIREYARFLNIDPIPLIKEYAEYQARKDAPVQREDSRRKRNFLLRPVILLVPLIGVVAAVLIIYFPKTKAPEEQNKIARLSIPPVADGDKVPSAADKVKVPSHSAVPSQNVLNITAIDTTWLRIEYEEGKSEEILMKPGETKKWTSGDGFNLKLGNAGGVKIRLNNKDMGALGEKGEVVTLKLP